MSIPVQPEQSFFQLPASIGYSENLSGRTAQYMSFDSPFEGDAFYQKRFSEFARLLYYSSPRHLLLVREAGVGDHAFLTEFARVVSNASFPHLISAEVVYYDCRSVFPDAIVELTSVLGKSLESHPNVLLCIEGMADLVRLNLTVGMFALRRFLLAVPCRVICIVSPQDKEQFLKFPEDLFSVWELPEPPLESALRLVQHYASALQERYRVSIADEAIVQSVKLSQLFNPSERLPNKAVKIVRRICEDKSFDHLLGESGEPMVTPADIVSRIAQTTGIPETTIAGLPDGVDYAEAIGARIVGQEAVVNEIATELSLVRAGMVDKGKPASVMLFVGQTGTGKTELAKVLARLYSGSKTLKTFTLGNFSEPHSVSGIIGVPPGYVGHEQGGRLVNELNADPYSVFLLDEADKAHPDVMQPFLNLFDEGWIIDQKGTKAFADRSIFILTTNVGQRQIMEMQRKGKPWDEIYSKLMESLSQIRHAKANRPVFTPEFLARIKRVVVFRPLELEAMTGISRQLCSDLAEKWRSQREKRLNISPKVVNWIAELAFEKNEQSKGKEGGRIVRKLIADKLEAKLQEFIASDPENYRTAVAIGIRLLSEDVVEIAYETC